MYLSAYVCLLLFTKVRQLGMYSTYVGTYVGMYIGTLPDGIFAYPKSKFGFILEGLGMKNYGSLEYVWPLGIVYNRLVCTCYRHLLHFWSLGIYFVQFWPFVPRKIWQSLLLFTHSRKRDFTSKLTLRPGMKEMNFRFHR
jgi:hypothetical protein